MFWKRCMSANSLKKVNRIDNLSSVLRLFFLSALVALGCSPILAQTAAQANLPTVRLQVGNIFFQAEVADEETERSTGLMFRKTLAPDAGMLFVMPQTGPVGFWMKNTGVPLTIAYLDASGRILELHDLVPYNEKIVSSHFPYIAYALEMPQGWFTKNNIWPGERLIGLPKAGGK